MTTTPRTNVHKEFSSDLSAAQVNRGMEVILENEAMRLVIHPGLGGRIDQITDLTTGKNWLWHPDSYMSGEPRALKVGACFDQQWSGGWDEVFPNDAAGHFHGRDLVDHGELWSQAWELVERSDTSVHMTLVLETVPITVEKVIEIDPREPSAQLRYMIRNHSVDAIPFLLKMHPAIAIEEGDELLLPDCVVEPVALGFSRIIGRNEKTRFPFALGYEGERVRVDRALPLKSNTREFFYCSDLKRGECGVRNVRTGSNLMMSFDQRHFPFVWVFQSYGGFEGHYVLVLEPSTTKSYDLASAYHQGTAAILPPAEMKRLELAFRIVPSRVMVGVM